jgi:Flp pilus assembly protein TadB
MPTIPMHLDLGFALLILGVLALLAFSPWFRRFAAVCVALLVVAAGVGYMEIKREKEQALAEECSSLPAGAHSAEAWQRILKEMGGDTSGCDKWLAEHPQAKAERERAIEQGMAQKCPALAKRFDEKGYMPPLGLESCEEWLTAHPQAKD